MTQGAFHFGMSRMADENTFPALILVAAHLHVHFRYQRADSVKHPQIPAYGLFPHCLGDPVCAEDDHGVIRDLIQFIDEYRTFVPQGIDHVFVVDHFMAHVDRHAE